MILNVMGNCPSVKPEVNNPICILTNHAGFPVENESYRSIMIVLPESRREIVAA